MPDLRRTRAADRRPASPQSGGGRLAGWVGRLLRLLLISLLASIAIEWIGMHVWWPELGVEHSHRMVRAEAALLQRNVPISWAGRLTDEPGDNLMSRLGLALRKSATGHRIACWAATLTHRVENSTWWRRLQRGLGPYIEAARNIGHLYLIRLTVLCLAAPLFILLVWVGVVDGLVQRDLRRWGGGRESSFVYHYAKRSNLAVVAFAAVVYLAMPFSVHPAIVLTPFAMACAASASLTASRFKKYL